jgi:hypothetical protein
MEREQYNKYETPPEIQGINGYKYRFNNLQIDGKSIQFEHIDAITSANNSGGDYLTWHERRRLRARSESASQDYYYRESYIDNTQDVRMKRTHEIITLKEKRSPSTRNHSVTNPKNNYSVLVNNTNLYRYSPKLKARNHHVGHKISMLRVSSPLHKARLQMWKNQNSGSSSVPSTESMANSELESPQNEEDEIDDDDEEEPPMLYGPGNQLLDDDMTDPEDNYESSLSLSSSERSLSINGVISTINTECVHGGKVMQSPLAPSLFPNVPPFISFASFEEKGPDLPPVIHKILKWKLTSITPLLVRKVVLNTGFRLMKSELFTIFL